MNKIKTVKIKNEDGSISIESYNISADARNIDMTNGYDVQEIIGTINVDEDGSIAEQLGKIKQTLQELIETLQEDNATSI